MNYLSLIILFVTQISFSYAADKKYPVNEISPELLKNANVIVRVYELDFHVKSVDESVVKYKEVYTILNENGNNFNTNYILYDQHTKVNYFKGLLYNKYGEQIDKLKKSDISDQSAVPNGTVYADSRVLVGSLSHYQYPYTVEFEYEIEKKASLFYPKFSPVFSRKLGLESATFTATVPKTLTFRYMEQNINTSVTKMALGEEDLYKWQIEHITPITTEPLGDPFNKIIPRVYTAPGDFSMDGYDGNMESWKNLGAWQSLINLSQDDLPESTIVEIKKITEGLDKREKIKKVYEYLQENTRYVGVQLGIGGWQPFKASFVDEKKYGDCKALSNYTKALLKATGINSYYTLVKAGGNEPDILYDFPSRQFNHVFLCVPLESDTVWLECTSQTNPFGYLGSFTSDRHVLLITEDGGKLVRTPTYKTAQNKKTTVADVYIDKEGLAKVSATINCSGLQFENNYFYQYVNESYDKQKKWLYQTLDISGVIIDEFSLSAAGEIVPEGTMNLDLSVPKYASVNGKRMFIQPNILSKSGYIPDKVEERNSNVYIKNSGWDSDSIVFHIPEGFHIEFKPETIDIESEFGAYHSEITLEENKVTLLRTFKLEAGTYPPEKYEDLREYLRQVVKADKSKIVFVNRT